MLTELAPLESLSPEKRSGTTWPSPGASAINFALRTDDGRDIPIGRQLNIGSASDNDLVLADPFVSARHCVVGRTGTRCIVVDGGSRNGTWLAGGRVVRAELIAGARLVVGQTLLRVVTDRGVGDTSLLGRSPAMERLRRELKRVATTRFAVLLLGESGTGKELAARAVHAASGRGGAFVALNCGAIASELVESELFGHERGAFTGATTRRPGVFEEADGGTLFLDEIGELPLTLQPKLLRALETGTIRAVGATGERRMDVRVVAATHRQLPRLIEEGAFRHDLYHRLAQLELRLPPLRERPEDILVLAHHFLEELVGEVGVKTFSTDTLSAMRAHAWPGNVRELRNAVQRGAVLGATVLEPEDVLPQTQVEASAATITSSTSSLGAIERAAIASALRRSRGNRRAAAMALGVPKSTLCDKVKRYGIALDEGA